MASYVDNEDVDDDDEEADVSDDEPFVTGSGRPTNALRKAVERLLKRGLSVETVCFVTIGG